MASIRSVSPDLAPPPDLWRQAFAEALPEAHVRFFKSLKLSVAFGDYLFVHAGVRPGVPLAAQTEADLISIRSPFLNHADPFGKIVVHGHSPGQEPKTRGRTASVSIPAPFSRDG